jgi:hypothetical protein
MKKKKQGIVAHICHPSPSKKLKIKGLWFRLAWAKGETLFPK